MPTKRVVKQKQKQKQSVTVNISLAKARSKSSAKKSGKKGSGRGSVMMLPPPIYVSPIDRLTPAMYGSQGQQIQQKSMEDLLKNFLSNKQKQTAPITPNKLGSSSVSYNPRTRDDVSEISDSDRSYLTDSYSLNTQWDKYNRHLNEDEKGRRLREDFNKFKDNIPTPFQNEERTYLKASEPDFESTAPKFSQDEARVSQGNIYESIKNFEPTDMSSKYFNNMLNRMEEKTQKEISNLQIPEPFRRPDRRPPVRIQLEDDENVLSENPFPKNIYNKMMGFN